MGKRIIAVILFSVFASEVSAQFRQVDQGKPNTSANAWPVTFPAGATMGQGGAPWTFRLQDGTTSRLAGVNTNNNQQVELYVAGSVIDPRVISFTAPQHIICDSGCGSAASSTLADATANPTVPQNGAFISLFDGTTWDRARGDTTNGLWVNIKSSISLAVTGTFWQSTQPVSGTFWQGTQPVSGTVTTTPPANASTNVAQVAGTATDVNSGLKSAGTIRVVLATDQPALTNKLLVTPDSVALPANQSVNVAQINAVTPLMGNGVTGTGSQRVTIASDNTAFAVNATLQTGANTIGALTANQSVNVAQMNGVATTMGNGIAGTGVQRVAIASDNTAFAVNNTPPANQSVNLAQVAGVATSTGAGVSDTGTQRVTQSQELTYSAGLTIKTATAAGTGPFFSICGSATKTVLVQRFQVSGTVATAAVWGDVILKRTSTATSAGAATTLTDLPYDSNNAAGTAVAKFYTVLATAGASAGVIDDQTSLFPITVISTTLQPTPVQVVWKWRDQDSQPPTLRGVAQCMEANFGTTTTNAPTLNVGVVWTEK